MIGTVINGKYEIRQALSESHQFEVFSALEVETGTTVVLKLMREELAEKADRVRLFADEVAQFARVDHPGVARILDIDMTGSRPFVVTEFVKGTDLLSWIQNGPVSFNEATRAIQGLATVLQAAYDQAILCRSVKLSNVLRTAKGDIKVLSFSLPRLKLVGREDADPAASIQSDLYFLGTAYYELLTGESPIRRRGGLNECWDEKLRQAMRLRHPHLNPEQIDRLVTFLDSTLTRDVSRRCKDHTAFLVGLADLLHLSEGSNRQNKSAKKQFASASEVVDAIQGRMLATGTGDIMPFSPVLTSDTPNMAAKSAGNVTALHAVPATLPAGMISTATGTRENSASSSTFFAEDDSGRETGNDDETGGFTQPLLHLINGSKKAARKVSHIWKTADEHEWYRNPLMYVGGFIFLVSLLILFW